MQSSSCHSVQRLQKCKIIKKNQMITTNLLYVGGYFRNGNETYRRNTYVGDSILEENFVRRTYSRLLLLSNSYCLINCSVHENRIFKIKCFHNNSITNTMLSFQLTCFHNGLLTTRHL